jgi:hypothetical protein
VVDARAQRSAAARALIYAIAPQMVDYANRAPTWVPYTMFVSQPDADYASFSTDEFGFRHTPFQGERHSFGAYRGSGPANLVVGGSAVFGVGATSNGRTIPGCLSERTGRLWLGLALRSYNSFQELLAFLLFYPRYEVREVVIFSGLNNVTLGVLVPDASPVYPSFYFQSEYLKQMSALRRPAATGRKRWGADLFRKRREPERPAARDDMQNLADNYRNTLLWFERDLTIWRDLGRLLGFRLRFVLQPVAFFHDKALSDEEQKLFAALNDLQDSSWPKLERALMSVRHAYPADVRGVCDRVGVPFADMNECARLNAGEWLYVDRAHMTDRGYAICADEILRRF